MGWSGAQKTTRDNTPAFLRKITKNWETQPPSDLGRKMGWPDTTPSHSAMLWKRWHPSMWLFLGDDGTRRCSGSAGWSDCSSLLGPSWQPAYRQTKKKTTWCDSSFLLAPLLVIDHFRVMCWSREPCHIFLNRVNHGTLRFPGSFHCLFSPVSILDQNSSFGGHLMLCAHTNIFNFKFGKRCKNENDDEVFCRRYRNCAKGSIP